MKRFFVLLLTIMLVAPATLMAATNTELEKMIEDLQEEIEFLHERADKNELHVATDRIQFTGDFRTRVNSLHYQDTAWNPAVKVDFDDFLAKAMDVNSGFTAGIAPTDPNFLDTTDPAFASSPLGQLMLGYGLNAAALGSFSGVMPFPLIPGTMPGMAPERTDIDNDLAYTTRLRLNMNAKVWDNVSFAGRLSMYKNWGDSTGVQVFDSWDAFTMDGTNSGNTTGDSLRVERAYFNWKDIGDSNFYLSIGRRPSTYGPPSNFRENELRGGTPSGHLVNFNFDGLTLGYNVENGLEGMKIRFCYGQGFESEIGNGSLYQNDDYKKVFTEDTHLGGFNVDILDDGTNLIQLTAFAALDVVDGFKGVFAFPTELGALFAPTLYHDMQKFPTFNFVTRYEPTTVIGDMYLGGLGLVREEGNGLTYFSSFGWTQLKSNGKAGLFGGMGNDALFKADINSFGDEIIFEPVSATDDDTNDGYGVYVGVQVPTGNGKLGLEYNYGSEYWTPFTQAQDDMLGSKLAVRGHVGEGYYIWDVNPKMFIKLAGLFYDYEYTNSGSPVGKPQKVDDVLAGTAFNFLPVVDTAWDANLSLTINF